MGNFGYAVKKTFSSLWLGITIAITGFIITTIGDPVTTLVPCIDEVGREFASQLCEKVTGPYDLYGYVLAMIGLVTMFGKLLLDLGRD